MILELEAGLELSNEITKAGGGGGGEAPDINIPIETLVNIHLCTFNSKPDSVRCSVCTSHFTNIKVENLSKVFVYITEFKASLK